MICKNSIKFSLVFYEKTNFLPSISHKTVGPIPRTEICFSLVLYEKLDRACTQVLDLRIGEKDFDIESLICKFILIVGQSEPYLNGLTTYGNRLKHSRVHPIDQ